MKENETRQIIDAWLNTVPLSGNITPLTSHSKSSFPSGPNTVPVRSDIPLFKTQPDEVTLKSINRLIRRSDRFSERIAEIKNDVKSRFNTPDRPEGVLYLVYQRAANREIEPIYIGKAETVGRTGRLSVLFGPGGAIRFAEEIQSNGHIGLLNEAWMFARGNLTRNNYAKWVDAFIVNPQTDPLVLRARSFIHMEIWERNSISIVPTLGHLPILTEEKLRIDLVRQAGRGNRLLNS